MDVSVWTIKKAEKYWRFWTVVVEKTLESPLDYKEIQPVHSKGDQSWVFIGRTDAEAETPILWPPAAKNWLTGILMLGKIEGGRRREWQRMRWLDGIIGSKDMNLSKLGNSEGQGSLVCFISQDHRVRHDLVSEQQNSLLVKERISKVMKTM